MRKMVQFDSFVSSCKFFTSEFSVNNGYGCTHPKQEETDKDEEGIERGKCYCHSCPFGLEADKEDVDNPDIDWGDIDPREECFSDTGYFVEGEYLGICVGEAADDEEKKAMASYDAYLNRYNRFYYQKGDSSHEPD